MDRRTYLLGTAALAAGLPVGRAMAQATQAATVEERVLGDPDAPVTIIEYASLTCPHCASFHTGTLPALKERYIDTGKAKLVYRDFPLDQQALNAAAIAHCAGPDRYFAFIEALYASQPRWAGASDPREALIQLAGLGGLVREKAEACLADESLMDAILQTRLDGQGQYGVDSTPTLIINEVRVSGGRSIDELATVIDAALP